MDEIVLNSNKITLSDSEFHWKFMNKYRKRGQQRSIFPTLFFYRITGTGKSVFRKEITFQTTLNKIQLNINFYEQNINSAPIFQNIRYYKNIIHNVLLNYSPIEEKLISTTSTRSNTGDISKAPLINFNKVKSGNENSTSFLPVTNYLFNSHFLDNTLLNTSASVPKSTPDFLEKSVIFESIKKSSFMNLLWDPSTRILNNYPFNLHVLNKKFFSPDSSFNTYSRKSKPAFGKLLKLIFSVHPRFLNNYPILTDSLRKADFECLKTLKSITPKGPEAENLLPDTFSKLALYSNWTYFSSHLKNLHGKGLKIPKSLWIPDFNYKNSKLFQSSKLSHHFLAVDFPVKLDSHKKFNQPKIGLFDVFSLESKNSASTKILARIFQTNVEYNSEHLLMETLLRCKTSFSGKKAPLIKIRNINNEGLPDIDHPSEIAYFNCFLNIHDIYAQDCNINSPVNPGSIIRNFHKICYSENSSLLNTLLNPRSYDVNPAFRRLRKPSPEMYTELAKYSFDKGYSVETFKSENYSSSKRSSSIKYIFKIPGYKKDSDFIRNWLNSISLKNLIKLRANFHGMEASKKPVYFIETSFKADHLKKLIYNEYISTLIPFKQSSLFGRYFIGLVYLKKDLFNASTSEDSSDGSFFVKNLHNTDCSRNLISAFKEILFINYHTVDSSEKNPSLFNSYLFNYHYSKNLGQVFRKSLKTILQKSPNFANVFEIDSSRYLANGNYFRRFPESLKQTNIFQNNIWFRHLVKKIESNPEQRKTPSPGKVVHNTGKVREIYSYAAKKLLSPGFLHVFQAGLRYENKKLLKMKISISRNRNLTNIIDGYLEGYFQNKRNKLSFIGNPYSKKIEMEDADYLQNKRNKLSFIGNPYSKKIEMEDADYLQNKRNKLSFTENLYCNAVSKLALYSNWTYFSSYLKNLHGKGLKIPKSLWIPDFNYKNSKLSHHFLAVDFPVKLDFHKKFNQPKIGLFDVFSLESKNSASTKILARIFQTNAEYNSEHLLMETLLRCKTSFSGKKAPLIKIRNIDNEGLPDIDQPSEIVYFNRFLNIHNVYAQDCNINSPVNPGSILRNFHKICYSENSSSSFLNTLLNPRSYDVNPVFRRFRKPSPEMHTELSKYTFNKGYSVETFKSENYSSSKRSSSIKYIFKIPGYKKYSVFIRNRLNNISLKNLIKLRANFHGMEASKKPVYFIETSFKADHLKKLIYNEYISTLIPFKQSSLFGRYFIGLVYLKKDLFNASTSEDSSDGSFFVKNLHNTDCSRNLISALKEILFINSHIMDSSEKNPSLFNSYLFNYHYSKNLGQVFRKSLKTILQKSPNFANVFEIDSSRYLANGNYFRHFSESLKRTNIFQNNIRFRHLVKNIESNHEQRKALSPGKEVHNTGKVSTGKVREIYSYAAKKLLSPGLLHVFQAGLRYENTKLLKMKTSISRNRNLTNIVDGYLEGYFQNKRNKLSFIGNPYSKKIFMDNPRDSKDKLPSFLSSFRYSTNNYSTKNMIPLKRKNLLLKTGPLCKISQIIASRNCNLILKHQAISGAGDSNLMFIMTKCKAENFFLESEELFGFKSADGIDYFQSENNLLVGNENLVYRSQENEITQSIVEEVKKIKKVVFDTQEAIVVNSSKDTFLNNTNLKQKIDIEYISEKVCQLMGHKMKIEAERRGIL